MATIRRPGATSAAVLIGLSASMVCAHLLAPEWSRSVGLDVWNFAAVEEDRKNASDERAEMESKAAYCARQRALADQLAARLVTGDAKLASVAIELLDLFHDDTGKLITLEATYPSVRDRRLLYARHAIDRVGRLALADPSQRYTALARLEADYRALERTWGSAP